MKKPFKKLTNLFSRLSGNESTPVFKSMVILSLGTLAGKIVGMASLPIITRLYPPESFGLLGVFTALVALSTPIATFYATAIPLPKRNSFALNVVSLSGITLVCTLLIASAVLLFAATPILSYLNATAISPYWPILILGMAGAGFYQILMQWGTRRKAFSTIAIATTCQGLFGAASKIILGMIGATTSGLLVGSVVQSGAGIGILGRDLVAEAVNLKYKLSLVGLVRTARRFRDFPLYRLPSQFLLAFNGQALMLFSASLFGLGIAGQVTLAASMLALPVALLGKNIGQAFYGEVAAIGRKDLGRVRILTESVVKRIFFLSLVPASIIFVAGPYLFSFVFGSEWETAGRIASLSAPYIVASFTSLPVIHVLNVLGYQSYYLRINITRTAWTVALFTAAHFFAIDDLLTIAAYYTFLSVHLTLVLFTVIRLLRKLEP